MKQITTFIADDGTTFDNYNDCAAYEYNKTLKVAKGQLRFYDYNYKLIADETLSKEDAPEVLLDTYYLYIGNEAAVKIADELGYLANCSTPKEVGFWYYDYKEDLWVPFTKRIEELNAQKKNLKF